MLTDATLHRPAEAHRRPRILVVSNIFPPVVRGGYEVECEGVVKRLRERNDVLVLTSDDGAGRCKPEPGVHRALPLIALTKRDSLRAPLTAVRGARTARGVLKAFRPDLVFVWNGAQLPHSALWVLNTSGVPLAYRVCEHWFGRLYAGDVFMRHLTPGERGVRGAWARAMRVANRHPALRIDPNVRVPAAVSWCSEFLRGVCPVPPGLHATLQETVLASTEHTTSFAGMPRHPDPDDPVVMFLGRLDPRKGPQVAVEALARLASHHGLRPRLVLVGAGSDAERAALERQAHGLGVGDRVDLPGPLRGSALAEVIARAHAWVVPSIWDEPMGLVAVESALARVPVVVSRAGGLPEVLGRGGGALYFDPGDAAGCAATLAATLSDPAAAGVRAERALERARRIAGEPYLAAMEEFVARVLRGDAIPGSGSDASPRRAGTA